MNQIKSVTNSPLAVNDFGHKSGTKSLTFRFLESLAEEIENILEERLPLSANVFNMSKVYNNFKKPEEMGFYVMNESPHNEKETIPEMEKNCWILATFYREDYGMRYAISAPLKAVIRPQVKEAFINCPYIDWNDSYHFSCIDFDISSMIWEISTKVFGNSVTSMPCRIYSIGKDEALKLELDMSEFNGENFVLQPMDSIKGPEFVCSTWKYSLGSRTEQAIKKLVKRNKSVGLYDQSSNEKNLDGGEKHGGKIICGMLINDCGLMGMLHTLPEYRGRGFATLVAKKLIKSFAEECGAVPCSAVEMRNYKSTAFHEKLGMTCSHHADFIKYVPQSWD